MGLLTYPAPAAAVHCNPPTPLLAPCTLLATLHAIGESDISKADSFNMKARSDFANMNRGGTTRFTIGGEAASELEALPPETADQKDLR